MNLHALAPDGSLYVSRNDEYRIRRVRPSGDTTEIVRDEPRVRLGAEERAEWENESERRALRFPEYRSAFFPIPEWKPYSRELFVDLDGRLWVSRYTEAVFMEYTPEQTAERAERALLPFQWRDRPLWDLFDEAGRYLGSVTLPLRTTLLTATGERIWGVQSGALDEDYVVRWRMTLPAGASDR